MRPDKKEDADSPKNSQGLNTPRAGLATAHTGLSARLNASAGVLVRVLVRRPIVARISSGQPAGSGEAARTAHCLGEVLLPPQH